MASAPHLEEQHVQTHRRPNSAASSSSHVLLGGCSATELPKSQAVINLTQMLRQLKLAGGITLETAGHSAIGQSSGTMERLSSTTTRQCTPVEGAGCEGRPPWHNYYAAKPANCKKLLSRHPMTRLLAVISAHKEKGAAITRSIQGVRTSLAALGEAKESACCSQPLERTLSSPSVRPEGQVISQISSAPAPQTFREQLNASELTVCITFDGLRAVLGPKRNMDVPQDGSDTAMDLLTNKDQMYFDQALIPTGVIPSDELSQNAMSSQAGAVVFESTARIRRPGAPLQGHGEDRYYPEEIHFIVCIKLKNEGKYVSQFWQLQGVAKCLDPTYVALIDAGTQPLDDAVIELADFMHANPQLGGACGRLGTQSSQKMNECFINLLQQGEYAASHVLDKPLESLVGYIAVLPGAFSMYSWECISEQGQKFDPDSPLDLYFVAMGEKLPEGDPHRIKLTPLQLNSKLAEDRQLVVWVVGKINGKWTVGYCYTAVAETDTPKSITDIIKQRRRWNVGSFSAFVNTYLMDGLWVMMKTKHHVLRKAIFLIQAVWYISQWLATFMSVALMWMSYSAAIMHFATSIGGIGGIVFSNALHFGLGMTLIACILIARGKRLDGYETWYTVLSIILSMYNIMAIIGAAMVIASLSTADANPLGIDLVPWYYAMGSAVLSTMALSACYGVFYATMFGGFVLFVFLLPSSIVLLWLTAMMRTNVTGWSGHSSGSDAERQGELDSHGTLMAMFAVVLNCLLVVLCSGLDPSYRVVMTVLFLFAVASLSVRVVASALYLLEPWYKRLCDSFANGVDDFLTCMSCARCMTCLPDCCGWQLCCPWRGARERHAQRAAARASLQKQGSTECGSNGCDEVGQDGSRAPPGTDGIDNDRGRDAGKGIGGLGGGAAAAAADQQNAQDQSMVAPSPRRGSSEQEYAAQDQRMAAPSPRRGSSEQEYAAQDQRMAAPSPRRGSSEQEYAAQDQRMAAPSPRRGSSEQEYAAQDQRMATPSPRRGSSEQEYAAQDQRMATLSPRRGSSEQQDIVSGKPDPKAVPVRHDDSRGIPPPRDTVRADEASADVVTQAGQGLAAAAGPANTGLDIEQAGSEDPDDDQSSQHGSVENAEVNSAVWRLAEAVAAVEAQGAPNTGLGDGAAAHEDSEGGGQVVEPGVIAGGSE